MPSDCQLGMMRATLTSIVEGGIMPEPFHLPGGKPKQPDRKVDIQKRYDVYFSEYGQQASVHRNVLFRGTKCLFDDSPSFGNHFNEFIELEQENGQSVFISRHRIAY